MINKLLRTVTSFLPVDNSRSGICNGCGECCRLPFKCFFLRSDVEGKYFCLAYKFRPPNCRKFPRTKTQQKEVIKVCSYTFGEQEKEDGLTEKYLANQSTRE